MSEIERVPFVDLAIQHAEVREEIEGALAQVLDHLHVVMGPEVGAFEAEFAAYCGAEHAVGVANGTDALELALQAAGIGPGDEVIVPANTFVATAEAVANVGATVVLADCDEHFLLDPAAAGAAVTPRTRAVAAVHLYGQPAAMEQLRTVVGPEVMLLEDAAQSQGARRHGRRAGSLGDIAATSFYPGKNLGAYGDAGAVVTGDADLAQAVREIGNHGGTRKYEHLRIGRNSRMDTLQAAVLSAKLRRLDAWNEARRAAAATYDALLAELPGVTPPRVLEGNEHVYHLYVVQVPERDLVLKGLDAHGIGAGIHYPTPVHLLPAFGSLGLGAGAFPVTEAAAERLLSLPMFPGITNAQQERVVASLGEVLAEVAG